MPLVDMQQVQANQPSAKQLFGKSQLLQKPVTRMASFGSSISLPIQRNRASTSSAHYTYNGEHEMNNDDLGSSAIHFSGISQSCPQSRNWAPPINILIRIA